MRATYPNKLMHDLCNRDLFNEWKLGKEISKDLKPVHVSVSVVRVMCGTGKQSGYLFIQMLTDYYFNQPLCNASAIMLRPMSQWPTDATVM